MASAKVIVWKVLVSEMQERSGVGGPDRYGHERFESAGME
jgi:hypothetical protein